MLFLFLLLGLYVIIYGIYLSFTDDVDVDTQNLYF